MYSVGVMYLNELIQAVITSLELAHKAVWHEDFLHHPSLFPEDSERFARLARTYTRRARVRLAFSMR